MSGHTIVDADGHITESTEQLAGFIDPAFRDYGPGGRSRSYYPTDAWDRSIRGTLGENAGTAKSWLDALDRGGMERAVLYLTAGRSIGWIREPDFAVALSAGRTTTSSTTNSRQRTTGGSRAWRCGTARRARHRAAGSPRRWRAWRRHSISRKPPTMPKDGYAPAIGGAGVGPRAGCVLRPPRATTEFER